MPARTIPPVMRTASYSGRDGGADESSPSATAAASIALSCPGVKFGCRARLRSLPPRKSQCAAEKASSSSRSAAVDRGR